MENAAYLPTLSGPGGAGKPVRRILVCLAAGVLASQAGAAALRVLKMGLGSGTVTSAPAGINCGTGGTSCDFTGTGTLVLTAAPAADFESWDGDCASAGTSPTCSVDLSSARSVRAKFKLAIPPLSDFTPEGIQAYLTANPTVNTPSRFLAALPEVFKQGWIFMSRSESLQPGVAESPRILFSNRDATSVFSIGMISHASYPGAHPNAIEYMQWDAAQKNFRFHEVVVDAIPEIGDAIAGTNIGRFPARNRGVTVDDPKCFACHSTRNVLNRGSTPGTDGVTPRTLQAKSKPNWDTYDSWGGMMPFNRDRIYQGSAEAAAFRKILNYWTWRNNPTALSIIEQLQLQPPGVSAANTITRQVGGPNDAQPIFSFDANAPVTVEPAPVGVDGGTPATSPMSTNYNFDGKMGTGPRTNVVRGGQEAQLRHPSDPNGAEEGRGVQLFDLLGGGDGILNQTRVADEINNHRFATGDVPFDVRPLALAITKGCLTQANLATQVPEFLPFFTARNGMDFSQILDDTRFRSDTLTRRKADIEKLNLDRTGDIYLNAGSSEAGLIQQYGAATSQGAIPTIERIRQEVFRRPRDLGAADATAMSASSVVTGTATPAEAYVNREISSNIETMALFRYFLEPLGVSVDKWSMGVRGRSRTYTFADVFGTYLTTFTNEIQNHLTNVRPVPGLAAPFSCPDLITAVRTSFASLPDANSPPNFTDVQRIFNKSCIECHGGQNYPPVSREGVGYLDFAENEDPAAGTRLGPSYDVASGLAGTDPATSLLFQRVTQGTHDCPDAPDAPAMMPCGGPPMSGADVETLRRWITGGRSSAVGDPHLLTVDGTNYDFQSAGEFTLLRDEGMEIQVRQSPVESDGPLGPNPHTGLATCVSINTAAAIRLGSQRITYEPNLSGVPDPTGLQLRIDGIRVDPKTGNPHGHFKCKPPKPGQPGSITFAEITLENGGRILPTSAPGGLRIQHPGGTEIVITPAFWVDRQVWYMNVDVNRARATEGVMGLIAPGNWLPALPNGAVSGPRPADLHQRYLALYGTFADAWRVTDSTSLFDYARGTSTRTFTVPAWPLENPKTCRIPSEGPDEPSIAVVRMARPAPGKCPRPPGGGPTGPVTPQEAQRLCASLVDPATRANCEADVQLTDERGFATTYRLEQAIQINKAPMAPKLILPKNVQTGLQRSVTFTWKRTQDKEGDDLRYRLCYWPRASRFSFDACEEVCPPRNRYPDPSLSFTVNGLERGKSYFWKVLVEDEQGGTTASETRLFSVRL